MGARQGCLVERTEIAFVAVATQECKSNNNAGSFLDAQSIPHSHLVQQVATAACNILDVRFHLLNPGSSNHTRVLKVRRRRIVLNHTAISGLLTA